MVPSFEVTSHLQLEALSLPIRTEIVETLASLGELSIRELGEIMGRKRPVLHFHVDRLVEVGLLRKTGERGEGRKREALYSTPPGHFYVIYDRDDPVNVELTTRYTKNMFSRGLRLLAGAFKTGSIETSGAKRDTYATQMTAWLSPRELAEVNRRIEELHALLQPSQENAGKRLFSLTLGLSPLHPEERDSK